MRSATSVKQLVAPYNVIDGGTCSTHEKDAILPSENPTVIENSEYQGLNGRIILTNGSQRNITVDSGEGSSGSGQGHIEACFRHRFQTFGEFLRQLSDCEHFLKNSVPQS